MSTEQESEIQKLIRDKTHDQIKMPYAVWSRPGGNRIGRSAVQDKAACPDCWNLFRALGIVLAQT